MYGYCDLWKTQIFIAGTFQMMMTTICGLIQIYIPCGMYSSTPRTNHPPGFYKHMTFVGSTR